MSVSDVIKGLLAMSGKKQAELTSVLGMSSNCLLYTSPSPRD